MFALVLPNQLNWRSESPYLDSLAGVANYKEGSGRGRLIQYGNTLEMALDHPVLGVGPGNWPVHYPTYMSPGDPVVRRGRLDSHQSLAQQRLDGDALGARAARVAAPAAGGRIHRAGGVDPDPAAGAPARPGLTDLTIVSTLIALVVVGAFDAVLLVADADVLRVDDARRPGCRRPSRSESSRSRRRSSGG